MQPLDAQPSKATVPLGEPAELAPGAWFARFSRALGDAHYALSPLSMTHRVFELVPRTAKQLVHIPQWRSLFLTPDGVLASDDLLPVVTTFATEGDVTAAVNRLRPMVGRNSRMTLGNLGTDRVLLIGPRDEVAAAIRVLRGK